MLRGNALAKIDAKGRLKVPSQYRSVIETEYGPEFFVTSIGGEAVRLYPMPIYEPLERRLLESSSVEPLVSRLRHALNFYGQSASMDGQGRLLIHPLLREKAVISGEVAVLGQQNYLEVWNRTAFEAQIANTPLTDADLRELASFGF